MGDGIRGDVTAAAVESLAGCPDPRLRAVLEHLVRHLHALVREVTLSPEEWRAAIEFLTRTGRTCDDRRQEFVLLSDVLGVSMLVDALAHRTRPGATESSVLGPFYVDGAPERPFGATLGAMAGPRVTVGGTVRDTDGAPIPGALLDVWQTAPNGLYHVQDPAQPPFHLCGRFRTDADGRYLFSTLVPVSYPVPTDGPVGTLLDAVHRHPHRPAHIHFIVSAEGHRRVVTELFTRGDRYLDSDAVFGVKPSHVVDYRPDGVDEAGAPRYRLDHDFVLERDHAAPAGAPRRSG